MLFPLSLRITLPDWWAAQMPSVSSLMGSSGNHADQVPESPARGPLPAWAEPSPILPNGPVSPSTVLAGPEDGLLAESSAGPARQQADSDSHRLSTRWAVKAIPVRDWIIGVWALGAVMVLGALARNFWKLQSALAACQPARERWAIEMQSLCQELQLDDVVRLDVHPELGPFLCWTPGGVRSWFPFDCGTG